MNYKKNKNVSEQLLENSKIVYFKINEVLIVEES